MIAASPFDSEHLGLAVGRAEAGTLEELARVLAEQPAFEIVVLRTPADGPVVPALAARGIQPVEYLVTSALRDVPVAPRPTACNVSLAAGDAAELSAIARITGVAITGTHFHNDPRLPRAAIRRLYEAWSTNDASGRAQRTIVARAAGQVIGYTAILVRDGQAIIDLIAVDPAWHGNGAGTAMLTEFGAWCRAEGLTGQVGTQHDNPALALYRRCGFVPIRRQATYHLWPA